MEVDGTERIVLSNMCYCSTFHDRTLIC